ncbi:MAG: putative rane-anchored protein [Paenibacillus sp.]|jgi:uncharacterized membrane-anchored protein|nr:putative rane-anchored protein [Paenibacillus sp.]
MKSYQNRMNLLLQGVIRADRSTKRLLGTIKRGEIALICHADLDEQAADGLLDAGVKAVINAAPAITGKFPHEGPLKLIHATIPLVEIDYEQFACFEDGETVSLRDGVVTGQNGNSAASYRVIGYDQWLEAYRRAEGNMLLTVFDFAENTLRHAYNELDMLLKPLDIPKLRKSLHGKNALIVSRGKGYKQDLAAMHLYVQQTNPVLIGVDGGADALVAQGLRPDYIIGDMDSVSDETLRCGAQLLVHAYMDGYAPGQARIHRLGLRSELIAAKGTSEDAAMRIAYEQGAAQIVTVGSHTQPVDFLEKGRAGMASTLLVRMMIGHKLIDAKGASLWSSPEQPQLKMLSGSH